MDEQRAERHRDDAAEAPPRGRMWIVAVAMIAFWTLPAALLAIQIHVLMAEEGRPMSWWHLFGWQAIGWYYWLAATPVVMWLSRRFPLSRRRWGGPALAHVGFALVLAAAHLVYLVVTTMALGPEPYVKWGFLYLVAMWAAQRLSIDLVVYAGLVGIGHALAAYRKVRERELQASELQAQLARAQLQALEMQLHPHFLFNTLHAISVLVRKNENQQAVSMLAGLSDLLRISLETVGTQEVPLKQELEFLERYLELERIRFQDRLRIELEIDPATLDVPVPNMILQPLVENAIRHGIAQTSAAGLIQIRATSDGSRLRVEVRDDGPGLGPAAPAPDEGVGLSNTRKRLRRLYGDDHVFSLTNGDGGGAVARVELPMGPVTV